MSITSCKKALGAYTEAVDNFNLFLKATNNINSNGDISDSELQVVAFGVDTVEALKQAFNTTPPDKQSLIQVREIESNAGD